MGMIYQFNKTFKIHNTIYNSVSVISILNTIANKIVPKKPKLNTIVVKFGMVYGIFWYLCFLRKLLVAYVSPISFHIPDFETHLDSSKITGLLG